MAVGQHRDGRGAASLIVAGDRGRIEPRKNITFARRRSLHFGYNGRCAAAQRGDEISRLWSMECGLLDCIERQTLTLLDEFRTFGGKNLVEYRSHQKFSCSDSLSSELRFTSFHLLLAAGLQLSLLRVF